MTTKISGGLVKTATITGNNIAANTISTTNIRNDVNIGGPKITSLTYAGDDTATTPAGGDTITIGGSGFLSGASVLLESTAVGAVTVVNANTITFTAPAKSAGSYIVYVVNTDGSTAILVPGIQYSGVPSWTTAAGSLGSAYETTAIAATLTATGDAPITYAVTSGSLPVGSTLASNGQLSGTAPVDGSSTTYTFTVRASDAQNQETDRQFSITINTDVVAWSSPANNTTSTWAMNTANTLSLSATSAAGYNASYTANSLPAGLSISGSAISGSPTAAGSTSSLITATAATTGRTSTLTLNWVIQVSSEPYRRETVFLLPANNSLTTNSFTYDASANSAQLTIYGDTRPSNFNPYQQGYYSYYLDGSGDYVSFPAINLTGNFTVEMWVFPTAYPSTYHQLMSGGASMQLLINGQTVYLWAGLSHQTSIPLNTWTHIALVRSGSSMDLFVNGVKGTTTTTNTSTLSPTHIGAYSSGSENFAGYISNIRIVNGTALYTSTFAPSTTPLTAIANTKLLAATSNRFTDLSADNITLTAAGNASISSFHPFEISNNQILSYGSAYFDGTGDYIQAPSNVTLNLSGDFTIEYWVYPTASIANKSIAGTTSSSMHFDSGGYFYLLNSTGQYLRATDSSFLNLNTWTHMAISRSGSTVKFFRNGIDNGVAENVGSATTATFTFSELYVGYSPHINASSYLGGYLSDFHIIKGTALYTTAFTPPTAPLTLIANTSLLTLQYNGDASSKRFKDSSYSSHLLTTPAGTVSQGTFSPYGANWSYEFPGTSSNYIRSVDTDTSNTVLRLGSSDFTIECWSYSRSLGSGGAGAIYALWRNSSIIQLLRHNGDIFEFYYNGTGNVWSGVSAANLKNRWVHHALVRTGTTIKWYINGIQYGTGTNSVDYSTGNYYLEMGNYAGYYFDGYISNFRITPGSALYSGSNTSVANFTPSDSPLIPLSNTSFLTCASNYVVDSSPSNLPITTYGTIKATTFSPYAQKTTPAYYSTYFDGTGDYATLSSSAGLAMGAGDFTVEGWVYFNRVTGADVGCFAISGTSATIPDNNAVSLFYTGGMWAITLGPTSYTVSNQTVLPCTWYHFAIVRNSGTIKLYINGTSIISTADSYNYAGTYGLIGSYYATTLNMHGSISNLRAVKGTAVYTSNFTPPTSPLTAIANTTLLMCQSNTLIDNSTSNITITPFGNVRPTRASPFTATASNPIEYSANTFGGSMYFPGAGNWVTAPSNALYTLGSGNFTFEFWMRPNDINQAGVWLINWNTEPRLNMDGQTLVWMSSGVARTTTGNVLKAGQWTHVAVVKSSGSTQIYINGVASGTAYSDSLTYGTQPLDIGYGYTGYISDFRLMKGVALYTKSFVPPATPLTPSATVAPNTAIYNSSLLVQGTSSGVLDASRSTNLYTVGDVTTTRLTPYSTGQSYYFDGTGDYITCSDMVPLGNSDFTVEMWANPAGSVGAGQGLVSFGDSATSSPFIYLLGLTPKIKFTGTDIATGPALTANIWSHVAVTRSGNTIRVFTNGVSGTAVSPWTDNFTSSGGWIGSNNSGTQLFAGRITDVRITKGVARYTSNFTPPTGPLEVK